MTFTHSFSGYMELYTFIHSILFINHFDEDFTDNLVDMLIFY